MEAEKSIRLLRLYEDLTEGRGIRKKDAALQFGVSERSIQRDIELLRVFFAEKSPPCEIRFDPRCRSYLLVAADSVHLNQSEGVAVCKILLESRSMVREELFPILDKLVACCAPEAERRAMGAMIANEKFHYIEPHHGQRLLDRLWQIGQAIQRRLLMEITYTRLKEPRNVSRLVEPVGLMFSEYYFYLTAFLRDVDRKTAFETADDSFPTIYRIDRIQTFRVLDEHFQVPYKDRFEEGEFRKRVQFMYGGKLRRIKFRYTGPSVEAVLDRLPTAKITSQDKDGWTIAAEVFGNGIEMWLKSQHPYIFIIEEQ